MVCLLTVDVTFAVCEHPGMQKCRGIESFSDGYRVQEQLDLVHEPQCL